MVHGLAVFTGAQVITRIAWMNANSAIQSIGFSGHESFPLRYSWLTKAVRGVRADPTLFARDDAVVRLGVGKNMVRAIRHWATRADVIRPDASNRRGGHYSPTMLGELYFRNGGLDPYLEDPATTWLMHWQLASRLQLEENESSEVLSPTTWTFMFNHLRESWFTLESAVRDLLAFAEQCANKQPSRGTVERDVSCFIRTYTSSEPDKRLSREDTYDSPLADLGLLTREPRTGRILFGRDPRPSLSASVFAYAVIDFWRREHPHSETVSFQQIAYAPGGPGQVFKLSENACVEYLDALDDRTAGCVIYDATAGLRQLIRHGDLGEPLALLKPDKRRRKGALSAK